MTETKSDLDVAMEQREEIDRLKKALDLACREIGNLIGDCPANRFDLEDWEMPGGCEQCWEQYCNVPYLECWRRYYLGKAER